MDSKAPKTKIVSVLFLDIVGYSKRTVSDQVEIKQSFNAMLASALEPIACSDRIVLDTGDGAAIAFLQHPEDALLTSDRLMIEIAANNRSGGSVCNVRSGIHFGPAVVVHDVNGFGNLVGDGINDAQRVMSFSGVNEVFTSRHYAEMVAHISTRFANRFVPAGSMKDKHGKSHDLSRVIPSGSSASAPRNIVEPASSSGAGTADVKARPNRSHLLVWLAIAGAVIIGLTIFFQIAPQAPTGSATPSLANQTAPQQNSIHPNQQSNISNSTQQVVEPSDTKDQAVSSPNPATKAPTSNPGVARPPTKSVVATTQSPQPATEKPAACPQCNCTELLTKTSLGINLSAEEFSFLRHNCR